MTSMTTILCFWSAWHPILTIEWLQWQPHWSVAEFHGIIQWPLDYIDDNINGPQMTCLMTIIYNWLLLRNYNLTFSLFDVCLVSDDLTQRVDTPRAAMTRWKTGPNEQKKWKKVEMRKNINQLCHTMAVWNPASDKLHHFMDGLFMTLMTSIQVYATVYDFRVLTDHSKWQSV